MCRANAHDTKGRARLFVYCNDAGCARVRGQRSLIDRLLMPAEAGHPITLSHDVHPHHTHVIMRLSLNKWAPRFEGE